MAFQRVKFSFPIWLFMAAALTGTAQDTLFYNGEAERKIGHRTVSYLASSDSILTLAQAKAHIDQKHFIVNEKPDLNLGIAKENYWRVKIFDSLNREEQSYSCAKGYLEELFDYPRVGMSTLKTRQ